MKGFAFALACACLALAACSEANSVPTEPVAPLFTTNTTYGDDLAGASAVFPSTNERNATEGWAHVEFTDVAVGQVTLTFYQTRGLYSCFEYRVDDEGPIDPANYNTEITDGLWNFYCLNTAGQTRVETFTANRYVDVRLSFGGEKDERFDWTRFYVLSPENKDQCKDGEWEALGFRNQGQCVRFVETGKDSRVGG